MSYSLFYQMTRLTRERGALKHDDRLDALAIVVKYWTDSLARSADKAHKDWEARELDRELQVFMDNLHLNGVKKDENTFFKAR